MDFDNETLYHHQPFLLQIHIQDILRKREFFNMAPLTFNLMPMADLILTIKWGVQLLKLRRAEKMCIQKA